MTSQIIENNFRLSSFEKVDVQDLFFISKAPTDLYMIEGIAKKIKLRDEKLEKLFFVTLIKNKTSSLYTNKGQKDFIYDQVFDEVIFLGRQISKLSYLQFSKKITHFMFTLQKHLLSKPLDEKVIGYQKTTFKIWLTFVNKLNKNQIREIIRKIHQGPYESNQTKNVICATFLYRLVSSENIYSDQYCFNLAVSGLFCELGLALYSGKNRLSMGITENTIYKYSSLILSVNSDLSAQNLKMILSTKGFKENNKNKFIFGQETYYFICALLISTNIFSKKYFSLKNELNEIKNNLPNAYQSEFRNFITKALEFFSWKQLPDQMTQ